MLKEGIIIGERYEIISRVGSGGMADVYKAMDHKLNRLVAVKVLKAEFRGDGSFVAKFRKEAQAAAGLAHPNIVNVYDVGEDRGLYYIVMELVEGITLKNYIDKKGKLSVKEATSIAIQVSLGLESAHNQGIVHRDVKPQNIIISVDGKVKLSDFGIAKAINSNTITANVMGSVHFSSPEQVRGGSADAKSDIYSLGITMYEMVTGRVPFDGDTTVAIAIKHLQEEIIPPSRYTPDLPYSLEQIILKCTQKNPDRRYASIGLLIDDLKHSLIDPQGNFVQMAPLGTNSSAIPVAGVASAEAAAEAARKAQSKAPAKAQKAQQKPAQKTQQTRAQQTRYPDPEDEDLDDDYDDDFDDDDEDGFDERPTRTAQTKTKTRSTSSGSRKKRDSDAVSSRLEKAITIGGFLIGAIIIIILIVVIGNMAGLFNRNSSSTTPASTSSSSPSESTTVDGVLVPDLIGNTLEEGQALAAQYGLEIRQTGTQESDIYAEGKIVSQDPVSGSRVDNAAVINVVVSSGTSRVTIPAGLVGATQTEVENILGQLNLIVTAELQSSDMEVGRVISMDPGEGTEVTPGSTVHIFVSRGNDPATPTEAPQDAIPLPELVGYDVATAQAVLDGYGIQYTIVTMESDQLTGTVLAIDPAAGTPVAPGGMVTLYVSQRDNSGDEYWVNYQGFAEPGNYMGGAVRIELEQNGATSVVYEGDNPFGDANWFTQTIFGAAGVDSGTIYVYSYNSDTGAYDTLIDTVPITFHSPNEN